MAGLGDFIMMIPALLSNPAAAASGLAAQSPPPSMGGTVPPPTGGTGTPPATGASGSPGVDKLVAAGAALRGTPAPQPHIPNPAGATPAPDASHAIPTANMQQILQMILQRQMQGKQMVPDSLYRIMAGGS